ncbi:MAG: hypothetical protein ACRDFS_10915 [Chloroflexota bacterium]
MSHRADAPRRTQGLQRIELQRPKSFPGPIVVDEGERGLHTIMPTGTTVRGVQIEDGGLAMQAGR